jgi:hypothetical protein
VAGFEYGSGLVCQIENAELADRYSDERADPGKYHSDYPLKRISAATWEEVERQRCPNYRTNPATFYAAWIWRGPKIRWQRRHIAPPKAASVGGLFHFGLIIVRAGRAISPGETHDNTAVTFVEKIKNVGGSLKPFQPRVCWPVCLRFREFLEKTDNKRIMIEPTSAATRAVFLL